VTIVFRDLTNYSGKIAHLADGGAALGGGFPVYITIPLQPRMFTLPREPFDLHLPQES
jgi:hypothetical protein